MKLKAKLQHGPLVVPGAYDALTALLVEKAGFGATYLTGAGLSVSFHGKPDIGLLTMDEVVGTARRMAGVINIPLIVDCDTGFGGPANVARTVEEMERAGVSAIQIEDQEFPKRCGHLSGKTLIPIEQMVQKIKVALKTRKSTDFLIIARTDARGVTDLKDALKRAKAYKKAGADILFPEALESVDEFRYFGRQKGLGVLMANMTEFGRSPALTVHEAAHLGYRLILFPMTAFRVAAHAIERSLEQLRQTGETKSQLHKMQSREQLYELIRYASFDRREKEFLDQTKRIMKRNK